MDLDVIGAALVGGLDLLLVRIDEQADDDAVVAQALGGVGDGFEVEDDIQAPLGGQLLAFFRHQGDLFRFDPQGDAHHLLGSGHLQVQLGLHGLAQDFQVAVLDVATVLPQVDGDPLGPGQLTHGGRCHRIGFHPAAGLAHGCDVIDV